MGKKPQKEKTLWNHLIPVNIFGLMLGGFAYFVRLQFNILPLDRNFTPQEDIDFSWPGLALYVLPCMAVASFGGWYGYLKEKVERE